MAGTPGGTHRWVQGGVMATGHGGIPMPDDVATTQARAGERVRVMTSSEAEVAEWRVVGLMSHPWPGPSEDAVVLADSDVTGGEPTTAMCFAAPQAGDWMIQVRLDYHHDRGHGNFFWHLVTQ